MDYSNVFSGVFGFLGKAVLVIIVFRVARDMGTAYKEKWLNYFAALGLIAFFSFICWSSYGTHTEDADPLKGGGETVIDFEPTDKERNEHGLIIFFSLSIPALYGIYKKQQVEPLPKEDLKARAEMERETRTEEKAETKQSISKEAYENARKRLTDHLKK